MHTINSNRKKKSMGLLTVMLLIVTLLACNNNEIDMENPDPDQFIQMIKKGTYKPSNDRLYELPNFSMKHVSALMKSISDTSTIELYPTNPMSSKYTQPKYLNECLMWTIEGIRTGSKYPSLEPCLYNKETWIRPSTEQLLEVAELYKQWFNTYNKNKSEENKTVDILKETNYNWH